MRVFEEEPPGKTEPPIDFWEHALELPAKRILEDAAAAPDFMEEWIKRRKPRQVAMLRRLLSLPVDVRLRERKAELQERCSELIRFVPGAEFAARKSMHAALDVAVGCLDEADVAIALEAAGRYDTTALVSQSWINPGPTWRRSSIWTSCTKWALSACGYRGRPGDQPAA